LQGKFDGESICREVYDVFQSARLSPQDSEDDHSIRVMLSNSVETGLLELTDALMDVQDRWVDYGLSQTAELLSAANAAHEEHGGNAVALLQAEGVEEANQGRLEAATMKWRTAIWLLLNGDFDSVVHAAWDALHTRQKAWEKVRSCASSIG
jgi:hypothetical protein